MTQSKNEYFHRGVTNQTKPDIIVDLRRIDRKKMAKWAPEQKKHLVDYLNTCEEAFRAFIEEITSITSETEPTTTTK